ncbi:hypothetical protein Trydic_g14011 [Trypoxylus dichotomus]
MEKVITKFRSTGLVANAKRNRVKTIYSPENIQRVEGTMLRSPRKLTRLSSQLHINRTSCQDMLKQLHIQAFKVGVMQTLKLTDYAKRHYCNWLLTLVADAYLDPNL